MLRKFQVLKYNYSRHDKLSKYKLSLEYAKEKKVTQMCQGTQL